VQAVDVTNHSRPASASRTSSDASTLHITICLCLWVCAPSARSCTADDVNEHVRHTLRNQLDHPAAAAHVLPPITISAGVERKPAAVRTGVVGCWLSHMLALQRFLGLGEGEEVAADSAPPELLLVFEDDVRVDGAFLAALPCWLGALPVALAGSWHVLRFSTWGDGPYDDDLLHGVAAAPPASRRAKCHDEIKVRDTKGNSSATERVSLTWPPRFTFANMDHAGAAFAYGGAHAVLYQRRTARELVNVLLTEGAVPCT
jgi:hypothetical protein